MNRCNELCTKEVEGYCGYCKLCNVLAERDRFERFLFKGGLFIDSIRALKRGMMRPSDSQSDKPTTQPPSGTNSWSQVLPKLKLIDDSVSNVIKIAGIMSLGVGGLIFLFYYWSIEFMPEMDVKALVTFLATSFFTAVALLL